MGIAYHSCLFKSKLRITGNVSTNKGLKLDMSTVSEISGDQFDNRRYNSQTDLQQLRGELSYDFVMAGHGSQGVKRSVTIRE